MGFIMFKPLRCSKRDHLNGQEENPYWSWQARTSKSVISTEFETLIETDIFSANEIDPCPREILPND
jgi:hypothetical protein